MEESDSSHNSSYCRSNSDESASTCSSTEDSEDLFLSLPTGVSPYCFEPVYDPGKEPSTISVVLPTDTEDPEVSCVGNTKW